MNKINIINNVKSFLFNMVVFCILAVSSQVKTYPHIPLKGLFEVLKTDDICFGHALLHSKWIENMFQYGSGKPPSQEKHWRPTQKDDAVANLTRKFWFRRSEAHQLLPTQFGCLANIPNDQLGRVFGRLINCIYKNFPQKEIEELMNELLRHDKEFRAELIAYLREVEDEEYKLEDQKFDVLKETKEREQEEINKLREEYKIDVLEQEIAKASKDWGRKKKFGKERKKNRKKIKRRIRL